MLHIIVIADFTIRCLTFNKMAPFKKFQSTKGRAKNLFIFYIKKNGIRMQKWLSFHQMQLFHLIADSVELTQLNSEEDELLIFLSAPYTESILRKQGNSSHKLF